MKDIPEIKTAIITHAELVIDEKGFLDAWLTLDYGGCGQGFGGYCLYLPKTFTHHKVQSPAGHFLFRVMEIARVDNWKKLVGKTIRVRASFGTVEAIGDIVKDDWFEPGVELKKETVRP